MEKSLPEIIICGENHQEYFSLLKNTLELKYPSYNVKHIKTAKTLTSNLENHLESIKLVILALGEKNLRIIEEYGGKGIGFVVFGKESLKKERVFYIGKEHHHGKILGMTINNFLTFDE